MYVCVRMCIFHAHVCVLKNQITVGMEEEEFEKIIFAKHTIFREIREICYPRKNLPYGISNLYNILCQIESIPTCSLLNCSMIHISFPILMGASNYTLSKISTMRDSNI